MKDKVRIGELMLNEFEVMNELRQACTMTPTIFICMPVQCLRGG